MDSCHIDTIRVDTHNISQQIYQYCMNEEVSLTQVQKYTLASSWTGQCSQKMCPQL